MSNQALILLNKLNSFSYSQFKLLSKHFDKIDDIFDAGRKDFIDAGLRGSTADKIIQLRQSSFLEKELSAIERKQVTVIDLFDFRYPFLLKQIYNPPPVIYARGDIELLQATAVAIVGSRQATKYGLNAAYSFARELAQAGLVVVSGLAKGVDTQAHKGALSVGHTIAVLGSGLCRIYPWQNKALARSLAHTNLILSEFPLYTSPQAFNFPRRNRIISGLSQAILVVQAAIKSGALITARFGLEQNRDIFALPGSINCPLSLGSHGLIKEGAKLVDSAADILEEFSVNAREGAVGINQ